MSKRVVKAAGLILAGTIALSGFGMNYVNAAQQQNTAGPAAGVSGIFADYMRTRHTGSGLLGNEAAVQEIIGSEEPASVEQAEVPTVNSEYVDIAIAQVQNYVNVRSEPNTESEVLGKLYNNSAASILEATEDGWYRIVSGNVNGYVKSEYVVVGNEELAKAVSTRYATVTTTTLFVRSEPTTESKVLAMLPHGDDLVVLDESQEGFVKVATVEGDGYISRDYVTLSTDYVEAESKEEEAARLAKEEAERRAAAEAAEAARKAREAEETAKRNRENAAKSRSQKSNGSASASQSGGSNPSAGTSSSNGQAVVDYAKQFVGNPYVYGGTSLTNGADCSGFIMSVYAAFGVSLPHSSAALRNVGYEVSLSDIRPGDIVCYSGHAGIYAGNNTLLHASSPETGIKYTSPVTYRKVLAVRRIF